MGGGWGYFSLCTRFPRVWKSQADRQMGGDFSEGRVCLVPTVLNSIFSLDLWNLLSVFLSGRKYMKVDTVRNSNKRKWRRIKNNKKGETSEEQKTGG
jgi:hypothetical protein